jgi:putative ABC transport system permease protein
MSGLATPNPVPAALTPAVRHRMPLWWRLAVRDLKTGLADFWVFIGCIALGVMVITAVGALSDALRGGLADQGRTLLGGDAAFVRVHARASAPERAWLARLGPSSETATLRTMARTVDGSEQALAELKAVDAAYPLAGAVKFDGPADTLAALQSGADAAVEPVLLERLGLKIGDVLTLGDARVTVRAKLVAEPDGIADRSTFGPRVLVSLETLQKTGLIQPGTLIRWRYAATLPEGQSQTRETFATMRASLKRDLPEAGFSVSDRFDPSPQLTRTLERLRQFLTLIGLTSLLVGGVGVANAVATFIDKRRRVIATMKSLGAPAKLIGRIFLAQILMVAALGVGIGLVSGYLVPMALGAFYANKLPFELRFGVTAFSVTTAAAYGLLVALLFTLWPLGRAAMVSPSVLFRDDVAGDRTLPRMPVIWATLATGAALLAFTVLTSDARLVALSFFGGLCVIFGVFLGVGRLVPFVLRRLPRSRSPELALAIGSIAAPGGLAGSVLLSLGLGLSLLVAVALVDSSLVAELTGRLPQQAPAYFVMDVGKSDLPAFEELIAREAPGSSVSVAPMLRGRLVALKDVPVENVKVSQEAAWVLTGDRGLTFSETVPAGSTVVAGEWWPAGYTGEPLVSFEADLAKKLGLGLGDRVQVNVLGRNISARISSLRDVKWDSLALNFVLVFSPNALQAAPYKLLATISLPGTPSVQAEVALAKALGRTFPAMTPIRVKDAIAQFNAVLDKVLTAVRVAGGVTLVSGALVLAGALATAQRRRILDAVILKAIGVTRRRILGSHLIEYGLLALIAAVFAILLGSVAAWIVVNQVMSVPFTFSWQAVAQALGLAFALVALFGGIGTAAVLRAPAVPYLKSE